ncbi:MAG TPA: helix-hairpin-helix domain-containing protein [Rhizomicrobium sp.]|nr:helix-hairpin-helix domain-containing protein [Rhizomicrobium sp.]
MRPQPARLAAALRFGLVMLIAAAGGLLTASTIAEALPGDLDAIAKASDLDHDPLDFQAVADVCTRCHAASQFLTTPRSDSRWEQVFEEMSTNGATGTDDQLNRVVSYFQKNLTVINVNTSPPDELGPTLQVNDQVVAQIVARRAEKKFADIDDLVSVAGVDRSILEKLAAKKCLQF